MEGWLKNARKYDKEAKALQRKTHYDYKRKKHVPIKPKQGFFAAAVREFYSDLADVKHDDNNLSKALKFAKRYHEKYLNDKFVDEEPSKKRFRESGGGRKCKTPEEIILYIFLRFLLCHFSMQKVSTRSN